jgi:DNA mismatch repair protein MutL
MPIQILSEVVAAQIAAGEVVERPASVVKELIENALDAGARTIRVEAEGGGRQLIRITDDGSGIAAHEIEAAFIRHATSKLQHIDDLNHLRTLGFRGEALASIAAVSQVELVSRMEAALAGARIIIEGGIVKEKRAAGAPVGTSISVANLFYNTPARLKFLKAESTERRHIDTIVTRYAIAYPNVRFVLSQDGRVTFSTAGTGDLADVLVEALGVDVMHDMIAVQPLPNRPDQPPISVYGYTSSPALNRNTRAHITLFINGRSVQDTSLNHAVSQAYHTLMPADRYPISVLLVELEPADVDVNVHPTKAEVRFSAPDAVFSAVQRAVRKAVQDQQRLPQLDLGKAESATPWRGIGDAQPAAPTRDQASFGLDSATQQIMGRFRQQEAPNTLAANRLNARAGSDSDTEQAMAAAFQADPAPNRPRTLPPLRVIGQLAATYIIAEGPAGLYLVDQHAAHERILYEQFLAAHSQKTPHSQLLLQAVSVTLPPMLYQLAEQEKEALEAVGFQLEPFGKLALLVRALPQPLAKLSPADALNTALSDLSEGNAPGGPTIAAQILLRVCKAAAIKAGQILSYEQMSNLLHQLEYCETPRACPHGRPTIFHISADQLAKQFGRT